MQSKFRRQCKRPVLSAIGSASRRRFAAVVVLVIGVFSLPEGLDAATATDSRHHVIIMEAVHFQPDVLTLRPGDSVTWTNKDPFPHTVVAENGAFKSGNIAPGMSWKHTIRTKGIIRYFCSLHATMKATLDVQ